MSASRQAPGRRFPSEAGSTGAGDNVTTNLSDEFGLGAGDARQGQASLGQSCSLCLWSLCLGRTRGHLEVSRREFPLCFPVTNLLP